MPQLLRLRGTLPITIFSDTKWAGSDLISGVPPREHGVNPSENVCELKYRLERVYKFVRNELKTAAQRRTNKYQYGILVNIG